MPTLVEEQFKKDIETARKREEDEYYWGSWLCWRINGICECGRENKPLCEKWKLVGLDIVYRITHKHMLPFLFIIHMLDEVIG